MRFRHKGKITIPYTNYTPKEVETQGEAIYEQEIRTKIEAKNKGKFLVIDIETGEYEIAPDDLKDWTEYEQFTLRWVSEAIRLLKPHGTIYIFMGVRFLSMSENRMTRSMTLFDSIDPRAYRKPLDLKAEDEEKERCESLVHDLSRG